MSDTDRTLGGTWHVEADGKAWTLTAATQRVKADFEKWLKRRAIEEVESLELSPAALERQMSGLRADFSAGKYRWLGPVFLEAAQSSDGLIELVRLLLAKHHPDAEVDTIRSLIEAAPEKIGVAVGDILSDSPNFRHPAAKPGAS